MPCRARSALAELLDPRLILAGLALGVAVLLAFGLGTGIIPNPVIGRMLAPEPFAIATWVASAPLAGFVLATYLVPKASTVPVIELPARRDGSTAGTIGGFAAFLAIGCPLCNKVALVLLGASGTMSFFAPAQPFIAAASLALLAATLLWRLDLRARGLACRTQPMAGERGAARP